MQIQVAKQLTWCKPLCGICRPGRPSYHGHTSPLYSLGLTSISFDVSNSGASKNTREHVNKKKQKNELRNTNKLVCKNLIR